MLALAFRMSSKDVADLAGMSFLRDHKVIHRPKKMHCHVSSDTQLSMETLNSVI